MAEARFTGQTYGQAAQQQASQRAVPPGPPPTAPGTNIVPLGAPTERPSEPITAGMAMGAGPGPEALAPIGVEPGSRQDLILRVRAIASRFPNPALLQLIAHLERNNGMA